MGVFADEGDKSGLEQATKLMEAIRTGGGQSLSNDLALAETPISPETETTVTEVSRNAMDLEVAQKMALEVARAAIGSTEDDLDLDSPLMDVGLDSLSAIAFREQLMSV